MQKLREFLATVDVNAFAAACGVSRVTVQNWKEGRCLPSPQMARKIEEVTMGGMSAASIRPDVFEGYERKRVAG